MRGERGMTLIEVSVTTLIISVGVLATLGTYLHFSGATNTARERAVLNSVAQREMEQLRALDFASLGMAGPVDPAAATDAPRTGTAASEPLVTSGVVAPGGDDFTYQGAKGKIYRYVTTRATSCNGLNTKVQTELATLFSQTVAAVSAAVPDVCPIADRTKRITVVVVATDAGSGPKPTVRVSTIKRDPTSLIELPNTSGGGRLALKKARAAAAGATTGGEAVNTQAFSILDTRCTSAVRLPPASHWTSDTSQAGFTCSPSGPAPTLMTIVGYGGSKNDPVPDFSSDVTRAATGGLAMLRDTKAGACDASDNVVYTNAETAQRKHAIHTWATIPASGTVETPTSGGRASLTLWTSTADGTAGPGRMCVTLRRASTGAIVGMSDFRLASWPGTPTELVTAFDLSHVILPAGERLLLTLRVPSDSGKDLRILYDHPAYQTMLSVTTKATAGF